MSYQPFLIAAYATGLDQRLQPWLLPNDAMVELFDGYVYKGVTNKRDGYSGLANGLKSTYCESRMVVQVTAAAMTGAIDGANKTYTINATDYVRRGTFVVSGSNPVQSLTDNGLGYFLFAAKNISAVGLTNPAAITTSANHGYTTGDLVVISSIAGTAELNSILAYTITVTGVTTFTLNGVDATGYTAYVSGGTSQKVAGTINYTSGVVSVTFAAAPIAASTVTATYSYHQGFPVMGVMNYFPNDISNTRQLLVVDTKYVNKYDPTTDRLEYVAAAFGPYNGDYQDFFSWVNYASPTFTARLLFCNGVPGDLIQMWDGSTITNYPAVMDDGVAPPVAFAVNARQIFEVRDRLVLFQTTEAGTFFPRRIRISGTGVNSDNFAIEASGAGFIDIPDNTFYYGAAFNRDDVLFFTEAATWQLKYTGNDVAPFILEKIDGSRGSKAAFSVISYLNRTFAASPRGLLISDGYSVERMDEMIPTFSYNSINNEFFESCFSGFLDEDRDVYMLFPSEGDVRPTLVGAGSSDRILVNNFEEDNFAVYRIPLSCIGNFQVAFGIAWSDLTAEKGFPNWDTLAATYGSWNSFPYSKGTPVTVGGGHKGEVWKLNDTQSEDNPQKIRAMTVIDSKTLRVTTDWNNYEPGDYIVFEAVGGMTEVNDKQAAVKRSPAPDFNTFDVEVQTGGFSAYTSGGKALRVIPFQFLTKQLNPFVDMDKKIRIGWIYFYVEVAETHLTKTIINSVGEEEIVPVPAVLTVDVFTNDNVNNPSDPDFLAPAPNFTYQVDCTNSPGVTGNKRWVKIWINQTARFLQFRVSNTQAGAQVKVHAMMPGMQPLGRLV